jgi:hypothetical protein
MKCFYMDNETYGNTWQQLLSNDVCHQLLFDTCFQERAIPTRHETHVLTFHKADDITRCVCTDQAGWYINTCLDLVDVKCCLDRGESSVRCRV